jgi:hypothetical protein
MMPTPTQGPVLTSAEAIAIVQGYLESKTYVYYSGGFLTPQIQSVAKCDVWTAADWQAVWNAGTWVVTREMDWDAYRAKDENRHFDEWANYPGSPFRGVNVDEWSLNERTRLVKKLNEVSPFASDREC